jgi:hypothetical protein
MISLLKNLSIFNFFYFYQNGPPQRETRHRLRHQKLQNHSIP